MTRAGVRRWIKTREKKEREGERGGKGRGRRERKRERRNYGKDKGKSTLMRRAKTKASIPREPIYDRAAIRYKCICATRNPYELRGGSGGGGRGEIGRGGRPRIREQVEGCRCLSGKAILSDAWIN